MDVSLIIVTFNSENVIAEAIQSIIGHKTDLAFEIIIIDNASTDNTIKIIQEFKSDKITLIQNKVNLGYSKANNLASKQAKGDYLFFINPDIKLKDYTIDKTLNFYISNRDIGLVVPKLLNQDGSVQESVRRFPDLFTIVFGRFPFKFPFINKTMQRRVNQYLMMDWNHNETMAIDWGIGAAMFIKKDYFNNLNGFDESFFLYCEDMDLCYRNKKSGQKAYYLSEVSLMHQYQQSSRRNFRLTWIHFKSIIRFFNKHKDLIFTRQGK